MITIQELAVQKQKAELELAQCRMVRDQYDALVNTKLQESAKEFERLAAEIKITVEAIGTKQILKPLFTRCGNVMTVQNGWICMPGASAAPVQYDRNTCVSVFAELKAKFLSTWNF